MKRWIISVVVGLGLVAPAARADKRVDWSQYLEPPGARPMPVKSSSPRVAEAPVKAAKAKPAKRVSKAKAKKSRAKAKATARKKRR
jgi:hypothetical protein